MNNFEKGKDNNEIDIYIIPKGTKLYRTLERENKGTLKNGPTFFALDKESVIENYKSQGYPYEFETTEDLQLAIVDKNNNKLFEKANKNEQQLLKNNYGMEQGNKRNSTNSGDRGVLSYICNKIKLDGYGAKEMPTEFGKMHAEIALCDTKKVKLIKQVELNELQKDNIKQALLKKTQKKTKRKILSDRSPPRLQLNFDSPSSPINNTTNRKLSFGGNKKNRITRKRKSKI